MADSFQVQCGWQDKSNPRSNTGRAALTAPARAARAARTSKIRWGTILRHSFRLCEILGGQWFGGLAENVTPTVFGSYVYVAEPEFVLQRTGLILAFDPQQRCHHGRVTPYVHDLFGIFLVF